MERRGSLRFLHGHIHKNYGIHIPQKTVLGETTVINACDYRAFDF